MGPEPQTPLSITLRAAQWDRVLDLLLVASTVPKVDDVGPLLAEIAAKLAREVASFHHPALAPDAAVLLARRDAEVGGSVLAATLR